MLNILFVDAIGGDYDGDTLRRAAAIGGTEVTLIRVAELLSRQFKVFVAQRRRQQNIQCNQVNYVALENVQNAVPSPDVVIVVRPRRTVKTLARLYPKARLFYWMHDIPGKRLWKYKRTFNKLNCRVIAISAFQETLIRQAWRGACLQRCVDTLLNTREPEIHILYNPVDEALQPDATPVKSHKLLFVSAPDRGLEQVIQVFTHVRQHLPQMELFVAHPGYSDIQAFKEMLNQPGIHLLGSLPHQEVIQHIREAYCIFYPQTKKPECFGLVYAEANAVGTPVLAHDFGAAPEVLSQKAQLINAADPAKVLERLKQWQTQGRPHIRLDEKFRSEAVSAAWRRLLS